MEEFLIVVAIVLIWLFLNRKGLPRVIVPT
jgi:hypothetical protein